MLTLNRPLLRRSRATVVEVEPTSDTFERGVVEAAAVLDEHLPGWHERITRPLDMDDFDLCVLGQVFGTQSENGFSKGLVFLKARGFLAQPGVFAFDEAAPYWNKEIERRKG